MGNVFTWLSSIQGTAVLHEMQDNLQKQSVSTVLDDHPSKESFWAVINSSHWPITKQITDQNVALLVQNVLPGESGTGQDNYYLVQKV